MSKVNFNKISSVFLFMTAFIFGCILGGVSRTYFEKRKGAESIRLQYLDEEIAIHRTRQLSEVREFLDKNKFSNVEVEQTIGDTVYVRVYSFSDKDIYTETFKWYIYNRNTGKITETETPYY